MKEENFELSKKTKRALKKARKLLESQYIDLESLALMENKKFTRSYRRVKQLIKTREFDDWNEL